MLNIFTGQTADDVWRKAFDVFRSGNNTSVQQSRIGQTRELLHVHSHIENPKERWVLSRLPAINPAFALAEVFWILSGSNDANFINFWNPILPKFAGNERNYHGAYGYRIRKQFGIDQLQRAYMALSKNPDTRQVVIQIWDPKTDLPNEDGSPTSPDVPCNICSIPKIRDGKLDWFQVMRSNDFFRGMPYNFVQFTMLQEILAGWLDVEVGSYQQISDSLHIYENDFTTMSTTTSPKIHNTDKLNVTMEKFEKILKELFEIMSRLTDKNLTKETFRHLRDAHDLPEGYRNILLITAADSARRRGWYDEMDLAADICSNQALSTAWNAWRARCIKSDQTSLKKVL